MAVACVLFLCSSAPTFLPGDDAIGQLDSAQVPPEDPVEERGVVVAALLFAAVPDGELVRDLEKGPFVSGRQLNLEELTPFFKDSGEDDNSRALVFRAGPVLFRASGRQA